MHGGRGYRQPNDKEWEKREEELDPRKGHGQVGWMPRLPAIGRGGEECRPYSHLFLHLPEAPPCACPVLTGGGELHSILNVIGIFTQRGMLSFPFFAGTNCHCFTVARADRSRISCPEDLLISI